MRIKMWFFLIFPFQVHGTGFYSWTPGALVRTPFWTIYRPRKLTFNSSSLILNTHICFITVRRDKMFNLPHLPKSLVKELFKGPDWTSLFSGSISERCLNRDSKSRRTHQTHQKNTMALDSDGHISLAWINWHPSSIPFTLLTTTWCYTN